MARVLIINGPNLGRLGTRQTSIYGQTTHDDLIKQCDELGRELGLDVEVRQSDAEADIVHWLHDAADLRAPVLLNAAAFTHYSIAVRDACSIAAEAGCMLIEVHLSNPGAREDFRAVSVITAVATGTISGFGADSYLLGLRAVAARLARA
jgi:3-dehydroquinate dehydratase II